ncbi:cysteine desulfurase family protein [Thalassobaculum sp. OXR-137]|uniref:cysteine desulfurase family protein n=1 Tax=Thalassobaculum sp. OXR-137 TaxID=3100173 RepID=UPI002AC9C771|nr:cysteine desulfurase family protein [Thalassobaculum sp. OXR-137]WPZ36981.1 cysteine desulfurase family protein [Thalassobaculum sp. OXR-137]
MTTYLDYNATAPIRPSVIDAMTEAARTHGNPSSVHAQGRAARHRIEAARRAVAALVGREGADVVFTSGGTEADALAVRGLGRTPILVSAIEHDAVLAAAPDAPRIAVTGDGVIDLAELEARLTPQTPGLVCVMWANNETGVVQPIAEIARLAHAAGWLLHVDAVQGAGRLDPAAVGEVDSLALSAHKIGGPPGIGALVLRDGLAVTALICGGGQERGRRSGTENDVGIAGFAVAAREAAETREPETRRLIDLRDRIAAGVTAAAQEARIMGAGAERLCNTLSIALPGVAAETQVMALDLAGIAVSAGSACSSGKVKRSHVLDAMHPGDPIAGQAIRVSLGWASTTEDADRFLHAWGAMRDRLSPAASQP